MKLLRFDSPEMTRSIAGASVWVARNRYTRSFTNAANAVTVSIILVVSLIASVRVGILLGVPALLALNAFLLWHGRSRRLNWVMAEYAGCVFIRLSAQPGRARTQEPDVIVLEAAEIVSISVRTVEVYLYGPTPNHVEWLEIEPVQDVVTSISDCMPSFLKDMNRCDRSRQVRWGDEEGRLTVGWKNCQPAVRTFLRRILHACPSIVLAQEEHSELDLNGIWHGISMNFDAHQRRMLVRSKQLGLGRRLASLLSRHKYVSHRPILFQEAAAYLSELEREAEVHAGLEAGSSLSAQTAASLSEQVIPASSCNQEGPAVRIVALVMVLGWTYIWVRSAASVTELTYASTGMNGLLSILFWSLVCFGIFESISLWVWSRGGIKARRLYLIVGDPGTLVLGFVAAIMKLFFQHSEIESRAYPLRILLLVCALFAVLYLARGLPALIRTKPQSGIGSKSPRGEVADFQIGGAHRDPDLWSNMNILERSLLIVSYSFTSALWTWLVIYYRYYVHSFLGQSSWVMAALWIVVISGWASLGGYVLGAFQSARRAAPASATVNNG